MSGVPGRGANEALIGAPGSRWRLNTLALVLDLDPMENNLDTMARLAAGAPAGATYEFTGDEFGCVVFADGGQGLAPGDVLECIVPHCDPTVNLHDFYHCVRGDTVVDIWPIDARGR